MAFRTLEPPIGSSGICIHGGVRSSSWRRSFLRSFIRPLCSRHKHRERPFWKGRDGGGALQASRQGWRTNIHMSAAILPRINTILRETSLAFFPSPAWLASSSVRSEEAVSSDKQFGLISLGLLSAPKAKSRPSLRYSNPNGNYRQIN